MGWGRRRQGWGEGSHKGKWCPGPGEGGYSDVGRGAFGQADNPAVSLAVLLLLPLKCVVPIFSCTWEPPGEL